MNLVEIGQKIHSKRIEAGLLQEQLARLTGLSRVTINQLENGTINDIGFNKLKGIFEVLGVDMEIQQLPGMKSALAVAARSISTSYKEVMSAETLSQILRSGEAPARYHAHLMSLLDETPLPVVVKAVFEAATVDAPPKKIMKNLHQWANQWKTRRKAF